MQTILVVILGPASAGKTSFIRVASDTDEREGSGCIKVEDDVELHLYRAPDTAPADATLALEAMWQVQAAFAAGYVLLLDSHRPETFHEGKVILDTFLSFTPVPFVVALNRRADTLPVNPGAVRGLLGLDQNAKILPCVATDHDSVRQVLLELLYAIIEASSN